jgi:hypothetical protein
MEIGGGVVGVAGLSVPVLTFAFVRRQPQVATVGEVKLLVDIKDSLYGVVAGGESGKVFERIADGLGVNDYLLAGSEAVDIDAEALGGLVVLFQLEARFGRGLVWGFLWGFFCALCDHEDEVTVQRSSGRNIDLKTKLRGHYDRGEQSSG